MKFDPIYSLAAVLISALLAWGMYDMTQTEDLKVLLAIVSFVTLSASALCSIAVKVGEGRSLVVMRATSATFFFSFLVLNFIFTFFDFSESFYVILNALAFLMMLIINRAVIKSKM